MLNSNGTINCQLSERSNFSRSALSSNVNAQQSVRQPEKKAAAVARVLAENSPKGSEIAINQELKNLRVMSHELSLLDTQNTFGAKSSRVGAMRKSPQ